MSYNIQYNVDTMQTHWAIRKSWQENRSLHVQYRNNILNSLSFLLLSPSVFPHLSPSTSSFPFLFFFLFIPRGWVYEDGNLTHIPASLELKILLPLPPEGWNYVCTPCPGFSSWILGCETLSYRLTVKTLGNSWSRDNIEGSTWRVQLYLDSCWPPEVQYYGDME